jgi:hypothetical protein
MDELLAILAAMALAGIAVLIIGLFSLKKLVKAGSRPAHYLLNRLAMTFLIVGFILIGHFWLVGGPTQGGAASTFNGYLEPYAAAVLIVLGIIITFVIYPYHRKTAAEKAQLRAKRTTWPWPLRHKWIAGLALLLVIIGLSLAYQAYARYSNHKSFIQARQDIDLIYADVVKQVGQPDNYKETNSCSQSYQEFVGYGDISCSIDTEFIYGVVDAAQANSLFKKIQTTINSSEVLTPQSRPSNAITGEWIVNDYYQTSSDDYKTTRGMVCRVNYIFDTPREIDLKIKNQNAKPIQINMGCWDRAKASWYPLEN